MNGRHGEEYIASIDGTERVLWVHEAGGTLGKVVATDADSGTSDERVMLLLVVEAEVWEQDEPRRRYVVPMPPEVVLPLASMLMELHAALTDGDGLPDSMLPTLELLYGGSDPVQQG